MPVLSALAAAQTKYPHTQLARQFCYLAGPKCVWRLAKSTTRLVFEAQVASTHSRALLHKLTGRKAAHLQTQTPKSCSRIHSNICTVQNVYCILLYYDRQIFQATMYRMCFWPIYHFPRFGLWSTSHFSCDTINQHWARSELGCYFKFLDLLGSLVTLDFPAPCFLIWILRIGHDTSLSTRNSSRETECGT